ncbi:uncharacterized protein BO97DRAFT_425087 [Aspergillus homomorphus CBS 101889]|uniref:Protein kinase domain-containing protein n=1 Tax=Aspergillus homomorphus (strain CBS 101889) TaxID=1450537 RepID=A0A395HY53_ASPHC|nr:hypothetical protein BO97DRAFT_425087 [Aspergillus homomorphus CBS 101889]RAL11788.1 hypothetical protein BO97DRAFT_425087 [Aspergillus homomorphus CBS 101889]
MAKETERTVVPHDAANTDQPGGFNESVVKQIEPTSPPSDAPDGIEPSVLSSDAPNTDQPGGFNENVVKRTEPTSPPSDAPDGTEPRVLSSDAPNTVQPESPTVEIGSNDRSWKTVNGTCLSYVPIEVAGSRFRVSLSGIGHWVGHGVEQGDIQKAWIVLRVKDTEGLMETDYFIIFDSPAPMTEHDKHAKQTIHHQCMDIYRNRGSWEELSSLLVPHFLSYITSHMGPRPNDIESFLLRRKLYLRPTSAASDTVTFEPCGDPYLYQEINWGLMEDALVDVPVYEFSDVESFREIGSQSTAYEVTINGNTFLYKHAKATEPFIREITMLKAMTQLSNQGCILRVPKLVGVIGKGTTTQPGLLTTLIPSSSGNLRGLLESEAEVSVADRQKWYDQVADAVRTLHRNGYCWGDVKWDNVVIDENRDAWLIDFEGGATLGWVDRNLDGTEAGDLQGLEILHRAMGL